MVELVQLPRKVLRQISKEVTWPLNKVNVELAEQMIEHIDDSQKPGSKYRPGVGVAAVQYGILKRMFYVFVPNEEDPDNPIFKDVMINPELLWQSDEKIALHTGEGCLSVSESWPNQEGYVKRSIKIKVRAYSYNEKQLMEYDLEGYVAIVFQHELDHLNGKLFIDHLDRKNPWKKEKDLVLI
ncbi:peptide deformylase [Mycoplasma testudineum]|uniref:Peptide deformylase n=1 Tax=Mycoplasma testudineum TaxID=244584 RepID=A0A4R6IB50_9MOLU|nr:peptide deformylase [Mycoplasma testudineum]OYD26601.1 peptide deformylase [Mycoplasma testudineum]TDO19433.1 peptide deformylase [Mycoplasma testudineum]